MFFDHFQFIAHPFAENPPVEWILRDPRMNEALARLRFFQEQGSMALIIGATGVGKSSLLRLFIHELPPNQYLPLYLHLTPINATAFLRLIVTHLGEAPRIGKDRLFLQIIDRIRQHDKSTLLMIDEAHMLESRALTDLRLLISSMAEKLPLTIILCGQESLRQTLRRASHADLVHRIPVRFFLKPLTKDQTAAYIDNRLTLAGGSPTVFDPETKGMIHDYTGGVPRQINNVATACLINGAAQNLKKITEPLVNQTMAELHLP